MTTLPSLTQILAIRLIWATVPTLSEETPAPMAERIAVQCEDCGHPYAARLTGDEVVLPTNDGKCTCGSDEFVEVQEPTGGGDGTTPTGAP